jgi:hypothetical protein
MDFTRGFVEIVFLVYFQTQKVPSRGFLFVLFCFAFLKTLDPYPEFSVNFEHIPAFDVAPSSALGCGFTSWEPSCPVWPALSFGGGGGSTRKATPTTPSTSGPKRDGEQLSYVLIALRRFL